MAFYMDECFSLWANRLTPLCKFCEKFNSNSKKVDFLDNKLEYLNLAWRNQYNEVCLKKKPCALIAMLISIIFHYVVVIANMLFISNC